VRSIQIFLISCILATLTLFNFVAALHGYQTSIEEADTLFDNQLLDLARLVTNLDLDNLDDEFRLGNNIAFQIWQDGFLLASSQDAPEVAMKEFVPGFDFANFDGYRWRTFARQDLGLNKWAIVAERTDLRFALAENVALESVFPILFGIPVIGVLIWLIISHGLKPLNDLSLELKNKQAHDLSPLHYENSQQELEQMIQSTNGFILFGRCSA
jgi:two-component system, OmpR family, sensor histidine kinase QseC